MTSESHGQLAVVTGATGGLGSQFCRQLAERHYSLLLVDRHEEALTALASQLHRDYGVSAETWCANLADQDAVCELADRLSTLSELTMLVNNAGFGQSKFFVDIDVGNHLDMINLHVHTPVRLSHAVLPGMLARNQGAIINVSSLSAWTPCAGIVQYSATKQFLVTFSEAVSEELRGTRVTIQALCPGFVETSFFAVDSMKAFDKKRVPRFLWVAPEEVVRYSLNHLEQPVAVPGLACRILGRLMRMPVARPFVRRLARNERHPTPGDDCQSG